MQIFDSHCHLNAEPLYSGEPSFFPAKKLTQFKNKTWQDHWQTAQQHGVVGMIIVGTDADSSQTALQIAQQDKNLWAIVGLHPEESVENSAQENEQELQQIKILLRNNNVVGVGEVGLDYYYLTDQNREQIIAQQKKLFIAQIQLANEFELPLILHVRDKNNSRRAYDDCLDLVKQHYQQKKPFLLHCVSGPEDYIQQALSLGAYISLAGNVTFKNAKNLKKIAKMTPTDKLLVETDAPFLAPEPFRGQINQPYMISETVKYLQEKLQINPADLLNNTKKLFELP